MTPRTDDAELDRFEVLAAGAVPVRRSAGGAAEVLVVHRPRYDDWTFPKGKLDPGETLAECAVREVAEETGLEGTLDVELVDVTYRDHRDRSKLVRYWAMTVDGGAFAPNDEVDEVAWVPLAGVATRLTYRHDQQVVEALLRVHPLPH